MGVESGSSDYWDLDCILAEQQRVPCFFRDTVPGLGFIEGNLERDLRSATRVELPFWLAQPLAILSLVDMELPACFGERVRNDLGASAVSVNLKQLCPFFYRLGTAIVQLTGNTPQLNFTNLLSETLIQRIPAIVDHAESAQSSRADDSQFLLGLDETEREIYKQARLCMATIDLWHTHRISISKLRKAATM